MEAMSFINQLGLTLGQDCQILFPESTVQIQVEAIARLLQPEKPATIAESPQITHSPYPVDDLPPSEVERLDRMVPLSQGYADALHRIEQTYQQMWTDATTLKAEEEAIAWRGQAKANLRQKILAPVVEAEIAGRSHLVYGRLPGADCLDFPDGRSRVAEDLIHLANPRSPEELWLREQRVQAQRIIRYRIASLDDAAWLMQERQRGAIGAAMWREMLSDR
jgi:hypothetical protein